MPALVAGIHVLKRSETKDVDGRDKPGHDVVSASIPMQVGITHRWGDGGLRVDQIDRPYLQSWATL